MDNIKDTLATTSGALLGMGGFIVIVIPYIIGIATTAQDEQYVGMVFCLLIPPLGWAYGVFTILAGLF